MRKLFVFLLVVLFSSSAVADRPKLRGPSRSLNCRPSISSMKDRGKPRVRTRTDIRHHRNIRGLLLNRHRPVESIMYEDRYYRSPQPIIVIVHVPPQPTPEPKPRPIIVRTSTHVTIFGKSSPNSRRFGSESRGGAIIFPNKYRTKTEP